MFHIPTLYCPIIEIGIHDRIPRSVDQVDGKGQQDSILLFFVKRNGERILLVITIPGVTVVPENFEIG